MAGELELPAVGSSTRDTAAGGMLQGRYTLRIAHGFRPRTELDFDGSAPLEPRPQLGPVALDRLLFRLGVPSAHVVPVLGRGENVSVVRARHPDGLAQGSHAPAGDLEARHANP